ncbi:MAG: HAMP domain-containing protein [Actinobacteria bacterium]|nr:HAMP domain-containing protein [Actinomycetota bacterium]MBI3688473.1 HAMP domain-containing protein [Actinomycetota bacterium]
MRLALLVAVVTSALVAGVAFVFYQQFQDGLIGSLDSALHLRADSLATRLDGESDENARPTVITESEDVAQVLTADGRVLESSPAAGARPLLSAGQILRVESGPLATTVVLGGQETRLVAVRSAPQGEDPSKSMIIVVGSTTSLVDAAEHRVRLAALVGGPLAAVLAGLGAWTLARAALRPVERMRRQADAIGGRDPSARLAVPNTHDEVAALAGTMNALLSRLQEALTRERGFVADAGHELRTPLTILRTELELAARPGRSREELTAAIAAAGEETDRLIRLAEDLLLLAKSDHSAASLRRVVMPVGDVVDPAVRAAGLRGAPRGVSVHVAGVVSTLIDVDPDRLRQALDNLLDNALRYSPDGAVVDVVVAASGPTGWLSIEVRDQGPGFRPDFLPHAFERFRRGDPARARGDGGTGLGLAIVRSVARTHGGEATAANRAGGGAVLRVELPRLPAGP